MKVLSIALLLSFITGCQLIPEQGNDQPIKINLPEQQVNYTHYYIWLKTLNNEQLQAEMLAQKAKSNVDNIAAIKASLINSVPNYLLNNAYNAKDILNERKDYIASLNQGNKLDKTNYAFITLLNDQLNQRILLIEAQQNKNKRLEDLEAGISQLSLQIKQLKTIENTLNNRGQ